MNCSAAVCVCICLFVCFWFEKCPAGRGRPTLSLIKALTHQDVTHRDATRVPQASLALFHFTLSSPVDRRSPEAASLPRHVIISRFLAGASLLLSVFSPLASFLLLLTSARVAMATHSSICLLPGLVSMRAQRPSHGDVIDRVLDVSIL